MEDTKLGEEVRAYDYTDGENVDFNSFEGYNDDFFDDYEESSEYNPLQDMSVDMNTMKVSNFDTLQDMKYDAPWHVTIGDETGSFKLLLK